MRGSTRLEVGTRVRWDGEDWRVVAFLGADVRLENRRREGAVVEVRALVESPGFRVLNEDGEPIDRGELLQARLAGLPDEERKRVEVLEGHIREVLTGYQRGHEALALAGEPREMYEPSAVTQSKRVAEKAKELGIAESSVWRYAEKYREEGVFGLVDGRTAGLRGDFPKVDARLKRTVQVVLAGLTDDSRYTKEHVRRLVVRKLQELFPGEAVKFPSRKTFNALLDRLDAGRGTFGHAKSKRERANQPKVTYRPLEVVRPGEAVVIDATPLDAFAIDSLNHEWVQVRLTVALDLYSGSIVAWRFTPGAEKSVDAALLLYDMLRPKAMRAGWPERVRWPYVGVPEHVIVELLSEGERELGLSNIPLVNPESVWIDHGRVFLSRAFLDGCHRLGASVQFARPYTPTDKANVERLFRTIREQFVQNLPGYKGANVLDRGKDVELEAVLFIEQIEEMFAEWVAVYWQRRPHQGLELPAAPRLDISPSDMFQDGLNRAGFSYIVPDARLYLDLLPTEWRKINHYGVDVGGLRYNGDALAEYRNAPSPYRDRGEQWPFRRDPRDLSVLYFLDPLTNEWHEVPRHKPRVEGRPFDENTLAYAKTLVMERLGSTRHARMEAISRELDDLLDRQDALASESKREHRLAARRVMQAKNAARDRARAGVPEPAATLQAPDEEFDFEAVFGVGEEVAATEVPVAVTGGAPSHSAEAEALSRRRSVRPIVDPEDFDA